MRTTTASSTKNAVRKTRCMLHSMVKDDVNAQFTYDHTGLRVKKTVNGVDTLYTLNGKKITHIRKGTNNASGADATQMHFFYDAQGRPAIVRYNGTDYAYLHNLQGDVTGIVDMAGTEVVQYAYDAWGKPVSTEGSMAATLGYDNPFRYRGYVWDEETGLYYLRSRYYDPEWGRFVNADELLGRVGGLRSHNTFAYCNGNPVINADNDGKEPVDATRFVNGDGKFVCIYNDEGLSANISRFYLTDGMKVTLTGQYKSLDSNYYAEITYQGVNAVKGPYWIHAKYAVTQEPAEYVEQNLKLGAIGPKVVELQELLELEADGIFGGKTEAAVLQFQKIFGIKNKVYTGEVGPKTRAALASYKQRSKYLPKSWTSSYKQSMLAHWDRMTKHYRNLR